MEQKTLKTISNKEAADKILSAFFKLGNLLDTLGQNFEAFKLVDVDNIKKIRQELLTASCKLHEKGK